MNSIHRYVSSNHGFCCEWRKTLYDIINSTWIVIDNINFPVINGRIFTNCQHRYEKLK